MTVKMGLANRDKSLSLSLSRDETVPYYPAVMYKLPANLGINFRHLALPVIESAFPELESQLEKRRVRVEKGAKGDGTS